MSYSPPKKINYLNNREILKEINESKKSFCYFIDEKYSNYDVIISEGDVVTSRIINQGILNRKRKIEQEARAEGTLSQLGEVEIDPWSIIIRVHTSDHIPEYISDNTEKKEPKKAKDGKIRTWFQPFKHYYIKNMDISGKLETTTDEVGNKIKQQKFTNIEVEEGGRSHWVNGLDNGCFDDTKGRISNRLALMFMKLVERYSQRPNWRGYSYLDEMKAQALLQLSQVGLQFDESKSENPFAYYTAIITTSFTRVLNLETRNQNMRDDILLQHGISPSHTKMINHELLEKYAAEYAKQLFVENRTRNIEELNVEIDEHYDTNTRKLSAKKDEFRKAVLAHFYDYHLNPPKNNNSDEEEYIDAMDVVSETEYTEYSDEFSDDYR